MTLWRWLLSFDTVTLLWLERRLLVVTVGADGKAFTGTWKPGEDMDALIRSFETQVDIEHYIPQT